MRAAGLLTLSPQLNGVLPLAYPDNVNKVADMVCVVFIFIYAFGYSMGFGPAAWVYGSEVNSLRGSSKRSGGGDVPSNWSRSSRRRFALEALILQHQAAPLVPLSLLRFGQSGYTG